MAPLSQAPSGEDDFDFKMINVWIDSFPEDDRWMPPLHGDDVDSFSDNSMKKLDEQKDNFAEFTRILETNGCPSSSLAEDFLASFEDERELQDPAIRRQICGNGINDDMSSLSTSTFHYKLEKVRLLASMNSVECMLHMNDYDIHPRRVVLSARVLRSSDGA